MAVGTKVTVTPQLCFVRSCAPHVVVCVKSAPAMVMLEMWMAVVRPLAIVTVWVSLGVPIDCEVNDSPGGVAVTTPVVMMVAAVGLLHAVETNNPNAEIARTVHRRKGLSTT
jgi:hypothetical protein